MNLPTSIFTGGLKPKARKQVARIKAFIEEHHSKFGVSDVGTYTEPAGFYNAEAVNVELNHMLRSYKRGLRGQQEKFIAYAKGVGYDLTL